MINAHGAFHAQAEHCDDLGSGFTARLMRLAGDRLTADTAVGAHIIDWPGNASHRADAVPLRLAGALHALARAGRASLAEVYPPNDRAVADDRLWHAVEAAMASEAGFILDRMTSPPQTNEVRRLSALYPGFLCVADRTGLPLVSSEIGASAGLNMRWPRYAYHLGGLSFGDPVSPVRLEPDWQGPPPPDIRIVPIETAGCDRSPLDPRNPEHVNLLLSYIWADQSDRLARTEAALAIAASDGGTVERADALDFLARRLAKRRDGAAHVVTHSIVWQYLPDAAQARVAALITEAGSRATPTAPLAWLRMEGDGGAPGAAITLTLWPEGREQVIGRVDFHGRWVDWHGWEA